MFLGTTRADEPMIKGQILMLQLVGIFVVAIVPFFFGMQLLREWVGHMCP